MAKKIVRDVLRLGIISFALQIGAPSFGQSVKPVQIILNRNVKPSVIIPVEESVSIQVRVVGRASGVLSLRLKGDRFLAPGWQDQSIHCSGNCTFEQKLILRPDNAQCGRFHLELDAKLVSSNGELLGEENRKIDVEVIPKIVPKPSFSRDSFNEICWLGCGNGAHELFRMDSTNGATLSFLVTDPENCKLVEGLQHARTYKYWVQATGSGFTVESNPVLVTQDNEAPPIVRIHDFSVDARGHVTLRWPFSDALQDRLSYIERYVIERVVRKNTAAVKDTSFTLTFFPMSAVSPASYVPVKPAKDTLLYRDDASTKISTLPPELAQAAMLQTWNQDRWNESDDFLTLRLDDTAYVYVAMDNNIVPRPTWLQTNFDANWSSQTVDLRVSDSRFRVFRSKTLLSGEVTLGGNFASGAASNENLDPKMYVVFVEPVNLEKYPYAANGLIRFTDPIGVDSTTIYYKVNAVDATGNLADGERSPDIIIDLKGRCRPQIVDWFVYEDSTTGQKYGRDLSNTVCVQDPRDDQSCMDFRRSDSLMFEAARKVKNFDSAQNTVLRSPWISATTLCFKFELGPTNFSVNGAEFFYRVRAKDVHGNLSAWSDTVSAIQDAALPGDIGGLQATAKVQVNDCEKGAIELSWLAAVDSASGVKDYDIHRKKEGETEFHPINSTPGDSPFYGDPLSNFDDNMLVSYKIATRDNVGHLREIAQSDQERTVRALVGPKLEIADSTQFKNCAGIVGTNRDTIDVKIIHNRDSVLLYRFETTDPDGKKGQFTVPPDAERVPVPIPGRDGAYKISAVAEFNEGTSTCSIFMINKRKQPTDPVENLRAVQDSSGSGNILVDWTHPDSNNISEYQIRVWPEDQPAEVKTFESPVSHFNYDFEDNMAFTYQCYGFEVRAVDCFGNISSPKDTSQYPKTKPTIVKCDTTSDSIIVFWNRPPRVRPGADVFDSFIEICREVDGVPTECQTFEVPRGKTRYAYSPSQGGVYFIRVRETLPGTLGQACADTLESFFSEPCRVPFKVGLPPVDNLRVQPLPVPLDSVTGCVFLSWEYDSQGLSIVSFEVTILNNGTPILLPPQDSTIEICGLDTLEEYIATVSAMDEFGRRSTGNDSIPFNFKPKWVFTPDIFSFNPACFRNTVTVEWGWLNADETPSANRRGADSVQISLGGGEFGPWLPASATEHTFTLGQDYSAPENKLLCASIRAKDQFGHISPTSTVYFGLRCGRFDDVPPPAVHCDVVQVEPPDVGSNVVNVTIQWRAAIDACALTAFYEVFRDGNPIKKIDDDNRPIYQFTDKGLDFNKILDYRWQVFATDRLGNAQQNAEACSVDVLLSPPDSVWCQDDSTFCWSESKINLTNKKIQYRIEVSSHPERFGFCDAAREDSITICSDWIDATCHVIRNIKLRTVYFQVQARVDSIESLPSNVFSCNIDGSGVVSDLQPLPLLPTEYSLKQNYPNPFNPFTTIEFSVPDFELGGVNVVLEVFNIKGQLVKTLLNTHVLPGNYKIIWDASSEEGLPVNSGLYIYRITAGSYIAINRMILLK